MCGVLGRYERGILTSHNIAKSKTRSKEMQVIHFDQDCASVWNFENFPNSKYFCTFFIMTLSLFDDCLLFESMCYLSFFCFSSCFLAWDYSCSLAWTFFHSCFLAWIFFFFFSIAHTLFWHMKLWERCSCHKIGVFIFVDEKACFCITLSVRVSILFCGCTWILIMGAWW